MSLFDEVSKDRIVDLTTAAQVAEWSSKPHDGGFAPDLDIDVYHDPACPGVSNSGIKLVHEGTLLDLKEYKTQKPEPKDWGNYGNAVHTAILQPELFEIKYTSLPQFFTVRGEKRPSNFVLKEGKDFREAAEAQGKVCLRYDEMQGVIRSLENTMDHPFAMKFLREDSGIIEGSCFWKDPKTGVLCKTRPDRLLKDIVVEIKTTEDPSPEWFNKSVVNFGYHRQGAFQLDGVRAAMGLDPKYFVIVAIGKKAPYHVVTHVINARAVAKGREEYQHVLTKIKFAQDTDTWEGYPKELHSLDLPEWAYGVSS